MELNDLLIGFGFDPMDGFAMELNDLLIGFGFDPLPIFLGHHIHGKIPLHLVQGVDCHLVLVALDMFALPLNFGIPDEGPHGMYNIKLFV